MFWDFVILIDLFLMFLVAIGLPSDFVLILGTSCYTIELDRKVHLSATLSIMVPNLLISLFEK